MKTIKTLALCAALAGYVSAHLEVEAHLHPTACTATPPMLSSSIHTSTSLSSRSRETVNEDSSHQAFSSLFAQCVLIVVGAMAALLACGVPNAFVDVRGLAVASVIAGVILDPILWACAPAALFVVFLVCVGVATVIFFAATVDIVNFVAPTVVRLVLKVVDARGAIQIHRCLASMDMM